LLIRQAIDDIINEELGPAKENNSMNIKLTQLRKIIREAIKETMLQSTHDQENSKESVDEAELDEDEFTYAIAKAASKGEKTVDIDGEKFPVKMSKEKAKKIVRK